MTKDEVLEYFGSLPYKLENNADELDYLYEELESDDRSPEERLMDEISFDRDEEQEPVDEDDSCEQEDDAHDDSPFKCMHDMLMDTYYADLRTLVRMTDWLVQTSEDLDSVAGWEKCIKVLWLCVKLASKIHTAVRDL